MGFSVSLCPCGVAGGHATTCPNRVDFGDHVLIRKLPGGGRIYMTRIAVPEELFGASAGAGKALIHYKPGPPRKRRGKPRKGKGRRG